jgi:hypothetical protein
MSPKKDTEKRCRMEKKADRIQYDEKIFFNGQKIFWNEVEGVQTYNKKPGL